MKSLLKKPRLLKEKKQEKELDKIEESVEAEVQASSEQQSTNTIKFGSSQYHCSHAWPYSF